MSEPGKYDDAFRRQMDTYREMPSGAVWEGVEAALDKKKKRRLFLWFWLAGAGVSVTALAGYLFLGNLSQDTFGIQAARQVSVYRPATQGRRANPLRIQEHAGLAGPATNTGGPASPASGYGQGAEPGSGTRHTPPSLRPGRVKTPQTKNSRPFAAVPETKDRPAPADKPALMQAPAPFSSGYGEPAGDLATVHVEPLGTRPVPGQQQRPFELLDTPVGPFTLPHSAKRWAFLLSVQGNAGAVRYVRSPAAAPDSSAGKNRRYGTYAGLSVKGGFILNRHLYVAAGIGYETHLFSGRYRVQVPGIANNPNAPVSGISDPEQLVTDFGDFITSPGPENLQNAPAQLPGRLTYQNRQLIFPVDIGYRFTYRRLSLLLAANATFAVPLAQRVNFHADNGTQYMIQPGSQLAKYNVSFGLEPTFEYAFSRHFSLLAGGRFAYSVKSIYRQTEDVIRPYMLGGHLGLRITVGTKPAAK